MRDMFPTSGSRRLETPEDTQELAAELGAALEAGDVVILDGPVGAGKTPMLIHVDAYRLLDHDASGSLDSLDLDTELDDAVVVAEWGGGLVGQLVPQYLLVTIDREAAVREDPSSQARYISWRIVETSES